MGWRASTWALEVALMLALATAGSVPAFAQDGPRSANESAHARGLQAYQRGDVATAMAALRAPARAGFAPSQSLLGFILERADFAEEAVPLWRAAAEQGDAEAHAGLANLYYTGRGVAKDEKLALQHFSKAAALGHAGAAEVVATAWLKGQMGTHAAADPAAAQAAVRRAAEQGHLPSAQALADAYRSGGLGLAPDAAQAAAWQARVQQWRQTRAAASAPSTSSARPAAAGTR